MDSCSLEPWDKLVSTQCISNKEIQSHCVYNLSTSIGWHSFCISEQPLVGYNRLSCQTLSNHQYRIRIDGLGRITLWNQRFLKKFHTPAVPTPIPSDLPEPSKPTFEDAPQTKEIIMISPREPESPSLPLPTNPKLTKILWALTRLLPCNRPVRKELISPQRPLRPRMGSGGRGDIDWTSYLSSQEDCN